MPPRAPLRQRGAALAYVLALLVIVGLLVGLTWRLIRSNNALAAMDQGNVQARLLALTGVEYALAKIGPPGPAQDLGYATEDLLYRLDDSDRVFKLSVRTQGLFARAVSVGRTSLPRPGRSHTYTARLGQLLDLGKLPAVGLLRHEGDLVLVGNAQVTGPVMLWRGRVRKATDASVKWNGTGGHSGAIWDSTSAAWDNTVIDFRRAQAWVKAQEDMLAARDFSKDGDFDSGMVRDLWLADSAAIVDTVPEDTRILAGRILRVGSGARLRNCKLISRHILIEGDAALDRTIVFAVNTLDIRGGRIEGGQFLAGDSVRIASDRPFRGYPVFYAQGRMANRGKPDSAMVGAILLEKALGEGLFLSACLEHPESDQEIRLSVSQESRISGLLYTPCYARVEGILEGSLICRSLKFAYQGTLFTGHLKDAHINALPGKKVIPAPLLFPGFPASAFAGGGP